MTKIEWTDRTWNPVTGCTKVSEGCRHCYAEAITKRFPKKMGTFTDVKLHPERLALPLKWQKPQKVFVNSMSDLFHEAVPDWFILRVFEVMCNTPWHTYQILTKRPLRMQRWLDRWCDLTGESNDFQNARGPQATRNAHPSGRGQMFAELLLSMGDPPSGCAFPLFDWMGGMRWWPDIAPNVWLGVSVEDQQTADVRIPILLQCPAAVRMVSYEPALGPVDFRLQAGGRRREAGGRQQSCALRPPASSLDWLIIGGESGPKARPFDLVWAYRTIEQCRQAGVAVFVKQLGRRPTLNSQLLTLSHPKGGDMAEWPEDLRVQEWQGEGAHAEARRTRR